jgi:hypothetical protein
MTSVPHIAVSVNSTEYEGDPQILIRPLVTNRIDHQ